MAVGLLAGGCHDQEPQAAPTTFRLERVPVSSAPFSVRPRVPTDAPEPLKPAGSIALPQARPIGLALVPGLDTVATGRTIELRAAVQAVLLLEDGARIDVTREATYSSPSGGQLSGSRFLAGNSPGPASVLVSAARAGVTMSTRFAFTVVAARPAPIALLLEPSRLSVTARTSLPLLANLRVRVRLEDSSVTDVAGSSVVFSSPSGGVLQGQTFVAAQPGTGSVLASYTAESREVTATLALDIVRPVPRPIRLTASPPALTLATTSPVELAPLLRFDAAFDDASSVNVTGQVELAMTAGGTLAGTRFTPEPGASSARLAARFTAAGETVAVQVPIALPVAAPAMVRSLAATVAATSLDLAAALDLRQAVRARVTLSDGSGRDVSGELAYSVLSGGSVRDSTLTALPGASEVRFAVSFPATAPVTSTALVLPIVDSRPRPISLSVTRLATSVAAGGRLGLREAVRVGAAFSSGPVQDVSQSVRYGATSGGALQGDVFVAGSRPGPASVELLLAMATGTLTSTYDFTVMALGPEATAVTVSPARAAVAAGTRYSLPANHRVQLRLADGSAVDAGANARFEALLGGSVSGTDFVPAQGAATGTIRVSLPECAPCSATLTLDIQGSASAIPVELALQPERIAIQAGGQVDLRRVLRGRATLSNTDALDVSGELVFSNPLGGSLAGTVFTADPTAAAGSVVAAFTLAGATVRAVFPFSVVQVDRVPVALELSPGTLGVAAGRTANLRTLVGATARFLDGSREDASAAIRFSNPSGGTLAGDVFTASEGASSGSILVELDERGHTVRGTLRLSIRTSRRGLQGLTLSPAAVTIEAGSTYGLTANVQATALLDDGLTETVVAGLEWLSPTAGRIQQTAAGSVYHAETASGPVRVTARYGSGGATRTATLGIEVVPPAASKAQLVLRPGLLALAPGAEIDLASNIEGWAFGEDGPKGEVTGRLQWVHPIGGTLARSEAGLCFRASDSEGTGSVLAVLEAPGGVLVAELPIARSEANRRAGTVRTAGAGRPLTATLGQRGAHLSAGPVRISTACLASLGLKSEGATLTGTPSGSGLAAFVSASGSRPPIAYDTWFLELEPSAGR